jgi:hypothetical protein
MRFGTRSPAVSKQIRQLIVQFRAIHMTVMLSVRGVVRVA